MMLPAAIIPRRALYCCWAHEKCEQLNNFINFTNAHDWIWRFLVAHRKDQVSSRENDYCLLNAYV